jgi:hypothetical protein
MSEKKGRNTGKPAMAQESKACGPICGKGFVIGYVDDINGEGAQLVNWKPTRAELRVLGLHYLERYYSNERWCVESETSGSTEWRESVFCSQRFQSIAGALGQDTVVPEWDAYIAEQKKILSELDNGCP